MTDRELLELAAKAAGIEVHESDDGTMQRRPVLAMTHYVQGQPYSETRWDPLRDDAQAHRLAADLRIDVLWAEHSPSVVVNNDSWANESNLVEVRESYFHSTKYEALRRAIVIAAAELAKQDKS